MVPEEMATGHPDYPKIDAVHADTPNRHSAVAFVPGPHGMFNSESDKHYREVGKREMGKRMFEAYLRLV